MIRICHPVSPPSLTSSSKMKLMAKLSLKNHLSYSMLHLLIHSLLKTVPKINSPSTKPILKLSSPHITKSPLNPVSFSKDVMLFLTMEQINKSLDAIFTLKALPLMPKLINQTKSKVLKLDSHLLQLTESYQSFHQPEDFSEEWKKLKFIKKPVERKLPLIFWLSFQLLNKIKNNKRKLKISQFFLQLLSHWIPTQLKSSTIYFNSLTKKSFWDYWLKSHWRTKLARKLSEWWLFQLMLKIMKLSKLERKGKFIINF